jgi:hypothetical protein
MSEVQVFNQLKCMHAIKEGPKKGRLEGTKSGVHAKRKRGSPRSPRRGAPTVSW